MLVGLWLVAGVFVNLLIFLGLVGIERSVNKLNNYLGKYADEKTRLDAEREKVRATTQNRV